MINRRGVLLGLGALAVPYATVRASSRPVVLFDEIVWRAPHDWQEWSWSGVLVYRTHMEVPDGWLTVFDIRHRDFFAVRF